MVTIKLGTIFSMVKTIGMNFCHSQMRTFQWFPSPVCKSMEYLEDPSHEFSHFSGLERPIDIEMNPGQGSHRSARFEFPDFP